MPTEKLILSKLLRRSLLIRTISSPFHSLSSSHSFFTNQSTNCSVLSPSSPFIICFSRSFSIPAVSGYGVTSVDGGGRTDIVEALGSVNGAEDLILPVSTLTSLLDGYHDFTGFPWWIIIGSSTLALRIALFPLLILQLNKLKRIAELLPKLPPPLPPPLSGRSYKDQFMFFLNERRSVGCPSFLWFLAYISIQFPCFLLWMTTVRRMALDHHTGFDCEGALWFQNLTEFPHGGLGLIFPMMIAGLHFINVQVSFETSSVGKMTGLIGLLVKYYKFYLDLMTLPILFTGFFVPQGSLVYWVTNSSLTLIQQLCLNDPRIRKQLGLPDKANPVTAGDPQEISAPVTLLDLPLKKRNLAVRHLSPEELVNLSIQFLDKGNKDRAVLLLRLALEKDPEHVRALIIMGQTLLQKELITEATEYLERAISRLFHIVNQGGVEEYDLLILASLWAGSTYIRQGKHVEGILHLERIGHMKEPEDAKSKSHYYDGLVMLASALMNEGRKVEAAKYLRMAVAYDPVNQVYLEQLENEEDDFVSDLVNSRRGDY